MNFFPWLDPQKKTTFGLPETAMAPSSSEGSTESSEIKEKPEVGFQKKRIKKGTMIFGKMGLKTIVKLKVGSTPILTSVFGAFWAHKNSDIYKAKWLPLHSSWGNLIAEAQLQNKVLVHSGKTAFGAQHNWRHLFDTLAQNRVLNWLQNMVQALSRYTHNVMAQPENKNIHEWEWIAGIGLDHYINEMIRGRKLCKGKLKKAEVKSSIHTAADIVFPERVFSAECENIEEDEEEDDFEQEQAQAQAQESCDALESPLSISEENSKIETTGILLDGDTLPINSSTETIKGSVHGEFWDSDDVESLGSLEFDGKYSVTEMAKLLRIGTHYDNSFDDWNKPRKYKMIFRVSSLIESLESLRLDPAINLPEDPVCMASPTNFTSGNMETEPPEDFEMTLKRLTATYFGKRKATNYKTRSDSKKFSASPSSSSSFSSGAIPRTMVGADETFSLWETLSLDEISQCKRFKRELLKLDEFSLFSDAKKQLYSPFGFSEIVLQERNVQIWQSPSLPKKKNRVVFEEVPSSPQSPQNLEKNSPKFCPVPGKSILKDQPPFSSPDILNPFQMEDPISIDTRKDLDKELLARVTHCQKLVSALNSISEKTEFEQTLAFFSESFRFVMENYTFIAIEQVFQCSCWLDEVRRPILALFERLTGLGQEYALLLGFLDTTKVCEVSLNQAERRLTLLAESINDTGAILAGISRNIHQLSQGIWDYIDPMAEIVQHTTTSTRQLADAYKSYYFLTEYLDLVNDSSQAHFETFMAELHFVVGNVYYFQAPKYKETLGDLQSWNEIVTDIKIDLQLHIQKVLSKVSNLKHQETLNSGNITTRASVDDTYEMLRRNPYDECTLSNRTGDSLDLLMMQDIGSTVLGIELGSFPLLSN